MKRILLDWGGCGGGGPWGPGPSVPAPQPPWLRPQVSPNIVYITGSATIDLTVNTTVLSQSTQQAGNAPYAVVLPNGNYARQYIQIHVDPAFVNNQSSAPFTVSGTFIGFTSLLFNSTGFSAQLEWILGSNGSMGWTLTGGNVNTLPA